MDSRKRTSRRVCGLPAGLGFLAVMVGMSVGEAAPPAKKGESHGEAAPRDVVPGEKVRIALLELGSQRMAAGRFDDAIKVFTDAAAQFPTDPKPLYLRGECQRKKGRLKEAEDDLRAALKLDPSGKDEQMVTVMAELGAVLSDAGRSAEAIAILDQAVKLRPTMFEAFYNLGVAHETLKHWPEAIAAYGKAIKLSPQDSNPKASQADAQYNLAVVYRRAGRLEEAVAPAREAVQLAPDRPHAHLNLGMLLSDTKRLDEAVGELLAAAQLADEQYRNTKNPEEREDFRQVLHRAYWRLGVVQTRREQASDAVVALEKAKALQSSPEVLTDLGLARRKLGEIAKAEAEFRAALMQNPKLYSARLHLASTLAGTGRCDDAARELALLPVDPQLTETTNR
ncbi:MAG TPA: tetratricopeptide repeat protein, partial [Pseudomonadota bacterium]|nr:tetratricopeptide repeat protein [Pseudomonadota bacterium]